MASTKILSLFTAGVLYALAGGLPAALAGDAAEKVLLRLRLKEGQVYRRKINFEVKTEMELPPQLGGAEKRSEQSWSMIFAFDVKHVHPDGTMSCEVTFEELKAEQTDESGTVAYDSQDPPDEVPMKLWGYIAMVGRSVHITFGPRGKAKGTKGVDEAFDEALKNMPNPDPRARQQLRVRFRSQLERVLELLSFLPYPEEAVAVGESWEHTRGSTGVFPMKADSTFTLAKREHGVAAVSFQMDMKSNEAPGAEEQRSMAMSFEGKGTQKGKLLVDESSGCIVGGQTKTEMTGAMKIKGPTGAEDAKIPLSATCMTTFESVGK